MRRRKLLIVGAFAKKERTIGANAKSFERFDGVYIQPAGVRYSC